MEKQEITQLRQSLENENISYGELLRIETEAERLGIETDGVMASDLLDEIENRIKIAATNFDIRITRNEACYILANGLHDKYGFAVMCKEYGDDEEWVGLEMSDLDEDTMLLDEDYQTLEIQLQDESKRTEVEQLLKRLPR